MCFLFSPLAVYGSWWFLAFFQVSKLRRRTGEVGAANFHQDSSKSDLMVLSYGPYKDLIIRVDRLLGSCGRSQKHQTACLSFQRELQTPADAPQ